MPRVEARIRLKFIGNLENPYKYLGLTCQSLSSFSEMQRNFQNKLKKWTSLQENKIKQKRIPIFQCYQYNSNESDADIQLKL